MLRRKKQPAPPLRRRVVLGLIRLGMAETDAADRDIHGHGFDEAKAAFDAAKTAATHAEVCAAYDALQRHGY